MKTSRNSPKKLGRVLSIATLTALVSASALFSAPRLTAHAGPSASSAQAKSDSNAGTRLHLEITGGDPAGPVDGASVYVRYLVKHRMAKDENVEMNLKTSRDGTVMVPFVPRGEVTVQIVADHWKPYGQKFQMTEDEQTIKIHLEKPPKWY